MMSIYVLGQVSSLVIWEVDHQNPRAEKSEPGHTCGAKAKAPTKRGFELLNDVCQFNHSSGNRDVK
jgi:hypothetical protein